MTIPTKPIIDAVGYKQACDLLNIAPDAAIDENRTKVLGQLDQCDFEPSAAWHDAVEIVFSPASEQNAASRLSKFALRNEVERSLGEEIENFAARFLAVECIERMRIWTGLCKRAQFSAMLSRRLALLELGLGLAVTAGSNFGQDRQGQLTQWVVTLFPMRTADRVDVANLAHDLVRHSPEDWEIAAEQLCRDNPEIARLVPGFVAEVRSLTAQRRSRELQVIARTRMIKRNRMRAKFGSIWGSSRWMFVVAVIFGSRFIASLLSRVDFSEKTNPPQSIEFVRNMFRDAEESARAKQAAELAAELEAALVQMEDRAHLSALGMVLLTWDVAESMPFAERTDARNRMLAGHRLTAEQAEMFARYFEELGQEGALCQIREFQTMALRKEDFVPQTSAEWICLRGGLLDTEQTQPRSAETKNFEWPDE